MTWECSKCTYINDQDSAICCEVCTSIREQPDDNLQQQPAAAADPAIGEEVSLWNGNQDQNPSTPHDPPPLLGDDLSPQIEEQVCAGTNGGSCIKPPDTLEGVLKYVSDILDRQAGLKWVYAARSLQLVVENYSTSKLAQDFARKYAEEITLKFVKLDVDMNRPKNFEELKKEWRLNELNGTPEFSYTQNHNAFVTAVLSMVQICALSMNAGSLQHLDSVVAVLSPYKPLFCEARTNAMTVAPSSNSSSANSSENNTGELNPKLDEHGEVIVDPSLPNVSATQLYHQALQTFNEHSGFKFLLNKISQSDDISEIERLMQPICTNRLKIARNYHHVQSSADAAMETVPELSSVVGPSSTGSNLAPTHVSTGQDSSKATQDIDQDDDNVDLEADDDFGTATAKRLSESYETSLNKCLEGFDWELTDFIHLVVHTTKHIPFEKLLLSGNLIQQLISSLQLCVDAIPEDSVQLTYRRLVRSAWAHVALESFRSSKIRQRRFGMEQLGSLVRDQLLIHKVSKQRITDWLEQEGVFEGVFGERIDNRVISCAESLLQHVQHSPSIIDRMLARADSQAVRKLLGTLSMYYVLSEDMVEYLFKAASRLVRNQGNYGCFQFLKQVVAANRPSLLRKGPKATFAVLDSLWVCLHVQLNHEQTEQPEQLDKELLTTFAETLSYDQGKQYRDYFANQCLKLIQHQSGEQEDSAHETQSSMSTNGTAENDDILKSNKSSEESTNPMTGNIKLHNILVATKVLKKIIEMFSCQTLGYSVVSYATDTVQLGRTEFVEGLESTWGVREIIFSNILRYARSLQANTAPATKVGDTEVRHLKSRLRLLSTICGTKSVTVRLTQDMIVDLWNSCCVEQQHPAVREVFFCWLRQTAVANTGSHPTSDRVMDTDLAEFVLCKLFGSNTELLETLGGSGYYCFQTLFVEVNNRLGSFVATNTEWVDPDNIFKREPPPREYSGVRLEGKRIEVVRDGVIMHGKVLTFSPATSKHCVKFQNLVYTQELYLEEEPEWHLLNPTRLARAGHVKILSFSPNETTKLAGVKSVWFVALHTRSDSVALRALELLLTLHDYPRNEILTPQIKEDELDSMDTTLVGSHKKVDSETAQHEFESTQFLERVFAALGSQLLEGRNCSAAVTMRSVMLLQRHLFGRLPSGTLAFRSHKCSALGHRVLITARYTKLGSPAAGVATIKDKKVFELSSKSSIEYLLNILTAWTKVEADKLMIVFQSRDEYDGAKFDVHMFSSAKYPRLKTLTLEQVGMMGCSNTPLEIKVMQRSSGSRPVVKTPSYSSTAVVPYAQKLTTTITSESSNKQSDQAPGEIEAPSSDQHPIPEASAIPEPVSNLQGVSSPDGLTQVTQPKAECNITSTIAAINRISESDDRFNVLLGLLGRFAWDSPESGMLWSLIQELPTNALLLEQISESVPEDKLYELIDYEKVGVWSSVYYVQIMETQLARIDGDESKVEASAKRFGPTILTLLERNRDENDKDVLQHLHTYLVPILFRITQFLVAQVPNWNADQYGNLMVVDDAMTSPKHDLTVGGVSGLTLVLPSLLLEALQTVSSNPPCTSSCFVKETSGISTERTFDLKRAMSPPTLEMLSLYTRKENKFIVCQTCLRRREISRGMVDGIFLLQSMLSLSSEQTRQLIRQELNTVGNQREYMDHSGEKFLWPLLVTCDAKQVRESVKQMILSLAKRFPSLNFLGMMDSLQFRMESIRSLNTCGEFYDLFIALIEDLSQHSNECKRFNQGDADPAAAMDTEPEFEPQRLVHRLFLHSMALTSQGPPTSSTRPSVVRKTVGDSSPSELSRNLSLTSIQSSDVEIAQGETALFVNSMRLLAVALLHCEGQLSTVGGIATSTPNSEGDDEVEACSRDAGMSHEHHEFINRLWNEFLMDVSGPTPLCETKVSRQAVCDVLRALVRTRKSNATYLLSLMSDFVKASPVPMRASHVQPHESVQDWEFDPQVQGSLTSVYRGRNKTNQVGLLNRGSTCYMNAVLQQLFHASVFRDAMLQAPIQPNNATRTSQTVETDDANTESADSPPTNQAAVVEIGWICWCSGRNDSSSVVCHICMTPRKPDAEVISEEVRPGGATGSGQAGAGAGGSQSAVDSETERRALQYSRQQEVLRQFQRTFLFLREGDAGCFDPYQLVLACDVLKLEFSVTSQNDASEFYDKVLDTLEATVKDSASSLAALTQSFSGRQIKLKRCHVCATVAVSREETFNRLELIVKDHNIEKRDLLECLEAFTEPEEMIGDNKVECDNCRTRTPTTFVTCLTQLPQYLMIHPKRFAFNLETMQTEKLNHRITFPQELNMFPYTRSGISTAESSEGSLWRSTTNDLNATETTTISEQQQRESDCQYELTGVIVHKGRAGGGHYYSFVRVDDTVLDDCDIDEPEKQERWIRFDDDKVMEFDPNSPENGLEAECFGGEYERSSTYSWGTAKTETVSKEWNAFMLMYRRKAQNTQGTSPRRTREEVSGKRVSFLRHSLGAQEHPLKRTQPNNKASRIRHTMSSHDTSEGRSGRSIPKVGRSDMSAVEVNQSELRKVAPSGTSLTEATLSGTSMKEAALSGTSMKEAALSGTSMKEATLSGVAFPEVAPSGVSTPEVAPSGVSTPEATEPGIAIPELSRASSRSRGATESEVPVRWGQSSMDSDVVMEAGHRQDAVVGSQVAPNISNFEQVSDLDVEMSQPRFGGANAQSLQERTLGKLIVSHREWQTKRFRSLLDAQVLMMNNAIRRQRLLYDGYLDKLAFDTFDECLDVNASHGLNDTLQFMQAMTLFTGVVLRSATKTKDYVETWITKLLSTLKRYQIEQRRETALKVVHHLTLDPKPEKLSRYNSSTAVQKAYQVGEDSGVTLPHLGPFAADAEHVVSFFSEYTDPMAANAWVRLISALLAVLNKADVAEGSNAEMVLERFSESVTQGIVHALQRSTELQHDDIEEKLNVIAQFAKYPLTRKLMRRAGMIYHLIHVYLGDTELTHDSSMSGASSLENTRSTHAVNGGTTTKHLNSSLKGFRPEDSLKLPRVLVLLVERGETVDELCVELSKTSNESLVMLQEPIFTSMLERVASKRQGQLVAENRSPLAAVFDLQHIVKLLLICSSKPSQSATSSAFTSVQRNQVTNNGTESTAPTSGSFVSSTWTNRDGPTHIASPPPQRPSSPVSVTQGVSSSFDHIEPNQQPRGLLQFDDHTDFAMKRSRSDSFGSNSSSMSTSATMGDDDDRANDILYD